MKSVFRILYMSAIAVFGLSLAGSATADIILFSNDFEDGNFTPEVGSWVFASGVQTVVSANDPTPGLTPNGTGIGLLDQITGGPSLNASINLTSPGFLTGGNTVTLDFDVAARRTSGNSRTVFVDALDSSGAIVTRLVLGDSNAFGNGGSDRQRIGYDVDSTGNANNGNSLFNASTGTGATGGVNGGINTFWFGSDGNPGNGFEEDSRDAQVSLTIGASSFGIVTTRAFNGVTYSTSGVANYNGGTFADVASFQLTSVGAPAGIYLDNIVVDATSITAVPEPSSFALISLVAFGFCGVRRRR